MYKVVNVKLNQHVSYWNEEEEERLFLNQSYVKALFKTPEVDWSLL